MSVFIDRTGQKFNRWTVIKDGLRKNGYATCLCRCDCGTEKILGKSSVTTGLTKSCGCYNSEVLSKRNTTHGKSSSRAYNTWRGMKDRCANKKHIGYRFYGKLGIRVCSRWQKFENFLFDMGEPPTSEHSLDRLNSTGDYAPHNCRWATDIEQNNNTKANIKITYKGETLTISQWADKTGINRMVIYDRHRKGLSPKRIFGPVGKDHNSLKIRFNGQSLSVRQWAEKLNMKADTIHSRYRKGWTTKQLFSELRPLNQTIKYKGKTLTLSEWSKKLNIKYPTLLHRFNKGLPAQDLLSKSRLG